MKQLYTLKKVLFILLVAFVVLACSGGAVAATATPMPTNTASPEPTNTPKPTKTPIPTATEIPPTAAPVPMGTPVSNGDYEVNVIYMRTLDTVYLDAQYHWVPTAGNMFVELGVKIVNLNPGSKVVVPWGDVFIMEQSGDTWYPNWGEFKPVANGVDFNPKKLIFRSLENPNDQVVFDEVAYMRAIYGVAKLSPTPLLFRFGDAPLIEVIVP